MEQRGAASGLGVGAWAAAVFAVQYGIARAVYAFRTADAARSVARQTIEQCSGEQAQVL